MRNIMTFLTLCFLTFAASGVFAEGYDESRRTERLGLSFYDGRPLYVVKVGRYRTDMETPSQVDFIRLSSGSKLDDYGTPYLAGVNIERVKGEDGLVHEYLFFLYGVDADGTLVPLYDDTSFGNGNFFRAAIDSFSGRDDVGDLGLNVADELFAMAKDIFGELFPLFAGIFALAAGSKYFEHLAKTGVKKKKNSAIVPTRATQEYFTLEKEVDQFSLASPNANSNKDLESNERRRFLDRLAGNDVEETNSVRESYITGARWGREFSEELQESNRRLLNDFEALDDFYRERLIQEFERLSFTQEAGFLKSYRSYVYGVGDDHQNGNPFADESDFAQTPWGGSPFGGGDFEDANRLLDEEYYDSYDGAY